MSTTIYFHAPTRASATNHPGSHCTIEFGANDGNQVFIFLPAAQFTRMQAIATLFNEACALADEKEGVE